MKKITSMLLVFVLMLSLFSGIVLQTPAQAAGVSGVKIYAEKSQSDISNLSKVSLKPLVVK